MLKINQIQGETLFSPLSGQVVTTTGVVTAVLRRGFFLQTANAVWNQKASNAIFVYSPKWKATVFTQVQVKGTVVDFVKEEGAKPITQIVLDEGRTLDVTPVPIEPVELSHTVLPDNNAEMAVLLNSLEAMLVKLPAGQTFIAPSNVHGDYVLDGVVQGEDVDIPRSPLRDCNNGVLVDRNNPLKWYPGFRIQQGTHRPKVNVGAVLLTDVIGPLHYRADSYQVSANHEFAIKQHPISLQNARIKSTAGAITVMTVNAFNLDPIVEAAQKVLHPKRDIDDDWGEGRFHRLAKAVAFQANCPDIIALQEIQDNDGAEISDVVDASETLNLLLKTVKSVSGVRYAAINVNPSVGEDGGQPGGNIRNAYLYNPKRVEVEASSVARLFESEPCFAHSRKPLLAVFKERESGRSLFCINVHLASKRHQSSIFAEQSPGVDSKESVRISQAETINAYIRRNMDKNQTLYITGDFNDTEFSASLTTLCNGIGRNLVLKLPNNTRYDYNHKGKLQALMHGIVLDSDFDKAEYEILHGNELIGVASSEIGAKASDHAYVLAKIHL